MTLPDTCVLELPGWVEPFIACWPEPLDTVERRMALAIELSAENVRRKTGGPFGAIVVDQADGRLMGAGVNQVTDLGISLAHAEMVALSMAQVALGDWNLSRKAQVQLVTSCEPCAMCFGAVPWSGVTSLACGARREDAEACGFDEGDKPGDWKGKLEARGIAVAADVLREQAADVLKHYVHSDGTIYNPQCRSPPCGRKDKSRMRFVYNSRNRTGI